MTPAHRSKRADQRMHEAVRRYFAAELDQVPAADPPELLLRLARRSSQSPLPALLTVVGFIALLAGAGLALRSTLGKPGALERDLSRAYESGMIERALPSVQDITRIAIAAFGRRN